MKSVISVRYGVCTAKCKGAEDGCMGWMDQPHGCRELSQARKIGVDLCNKTVERGWLSYQSK